MRSGPVVSLLDCQSGDGVQISARVGICAAISASLSQLPGADLEHREILPRKDMDSQHSPIETLRICAYVPIYNHFILNILVYCIVLYCIVLYCIVLYCIVLYCIILYCIYTFI